VNKLIHRFAASAGLIALCLVCAPVMSQDTSANADTIDSNNVVERVGTDDRIVPNDYAENYAFTDPSDRKTFLKLTSELRCPLCQNQNIADSDAQIAHDMRRKVYQLVQEGNDEAQVIDWMKQRYGDFVHYQPPINAVTMWLWLAPVLFAFVMIFVLVRRRKVVDDNDIEARLARAEQLLKEE